MTLGIVLAYMVISSKSWEGNKSNSRGRVEFVVKVDKSIAQSILEMNGRQVCLPPQTASDPGIAQTIK